MSKSLNSLLQNKLIGYILIKFAMTVYVNFKVKILQGVAGGHLEIRA